MSSWKERSAYSADLSANAELIQIVCHAKSQSTQRKDNQLSKTKKYLAPLRLGVR
jgi:hypothetical protein